MFKAVITTEDNRNIYLEYDKEKYDIEYVKNEKSIILRRLCDNEVLKIFNDKVGFIVQSNVLGKDNFVVTDYSNDEKSMRPNIIFKHYVDDKYLGFKLEKECKCNSIHHNDSRVGNSSFIVEQSYYGGKVYNLDEISQRFDHIYNDKKVNELVGEDILMVSENKSASYRSDLIDTITYGINPDTLEIVTPIWSEMQQRYINIYTQEQVDELQEKLANEGRSVNTKDFSLGDITIYFEIEKYLDMLVSYISSPNKIYLDSMKSKINENFVKSFSRK